MEKTFQSEAMTCCHGSLKAFDHEKHVCVLYDHPSQFQKSVGDHIRQGLNNHEKVICILKKETHDHILSFLTDIDFEFYRDKNQYVFLRAEDVYFDNGHFDGVRTIKEFKEICKQAKTEEFNGIRTVGEATNTMKVSDMVACESNVNRDILPFQNVKILCLYNLNDFSSKTLSDVLHVHPSCCINNVFYFNPFYIPPEENLTIEKEDWILRKKILQMKDHKKREQTIMNIYKQIEYLKDIGALLAHDLRAPIRRANTLKEFLLDDMEYNLTPETRDLFDRMSQALDEAYKRIDSIKDLTKISYDTKKFIDIDINAILDDVLGNYGGMIQKTGGRINIKKSHPNMILGDPVQINQLFTNIIENSIKYRHPNRPLIINIQIRTDNHSKVTLSFQDNGIGFLPSYKEKIFEPFVRLHKHKQYSGEGVGLTLCQKIVENHKGKISAEGVPGQGACFTVMFPQNELFRK